MKTIYGGSATPTIKPRDKDTARSLKAIGQAIQREMTRASNSADVHNFVKQSDKVGADLTRFQFLGGLMDEVVRYAEERGYDMSELLGVKEYDDDISVC